MTKLLDGHACSREIRESLKIDAQKYLDLMKRRPHLSVILASDDPASQLYVSRKIKACGEVGIQSTLHVYSPNCSWHGCKSAEEFVRKMLMTPPCRPENRWDTTPTADGVLVQLPIAGMENPRPLFDLILPEKDVDVFNPENVGRLVQGRPRFETCTPAGIVRLLLHNNISLSGKSVCIINDSDIVGKPLSTLLVQEGATVTICHRKTQRGFLNHLTKLSDIVVVAVGIAGFLTEDMIDDYAIVVDVGINRLPDGKVVGDVHPDAQRKAAYYSPVPGGVGPMTVTMLLANTLKAAWNQAGSFYNGENRD